MKFIGLYIQLEISGDLDTSQPSSLVGLFWGLWFLFWTSGLFKDLQEIQRCGKWTEDSGDTQIFSIWSNLADFWAHPCKDILKMHASIYIQVMLCAQTWPVCSPASINTLMCLIWLDLAQIWLSAHKVMACTHTSWEALVKFCA